MNRILALSAALALVASCAKNDKQTVVTNQSPSDPAGSVVGFVTSLRTGEPLAGVSVSTVTAGGLRTATTDASGAYVVGGLVAGATYVVHFGMTGYVSGFGSATVPNSAGNYPSNGVAQLNIALAQANSTLTGHVYARDGAAAAGVVVTVDLRRQGFDLVASATTDAQGLYTLANLPGAPTGLPVSVVVQPWDANNDGLADYNSLTLSAATYPGATSLLDVDLRLAAASLLLITSNLESGTLPVDAQIHLTFNRALDATLTSATLYDSTTGAYVAIATSLDTTGKVLTVVPNGSTVLAANHRYRLDAYAFAAASSATAIVTRYFTAEVTATLLGAVTGLTVNPVKADYDTATFSLSWNAMAGASGYEVWVRDTSRNPDWLRLASVGSSPMPGVSSLTLPSTFDYYTADGIQTPFAYGVAVDFAVVAVNAAGDAPLPSTATAVRRTDATAPSVVSAVQTGNADNTGGTAAKTITLAVTWDEYMDTAVAPTIALPTGLTSTFAWNKDLVSGLFTITIPASTDGSGAYTIAAAKDTSANVMTARSGTLRKQVQLVANGGFEAGALTNWTTGFTGTSTAPVISSATGTVASGTYSAQVGNATTAAQGGYSTIYQNVSLPAGAIAINLSISYKSYSNYGSYYYWDHDACYVEDSTGVTTYTTVFSTYYNWGSFRTATANLSSYAGQTVRITCETYQYGWAVTGMYLDDVSIIATL